MSDRNPVWVCPFCRLRTPPLHVLHDAVGHYVVCPRCCVRFNVPAGTFRCPAAYGSNPRKAVPHA